MMIKAAGDHQPMTYHVPAHPGSSSTEVSRRMTTLARRDNAGERALRGALHARGLRYRVTYKVPGLPRRTIDIAFTRIKVAVFIDGCFWHGCPEHGTSPRSNSDWWAEKIAANRGRDADTTAHLEAAGWHVVRVWEHVALDESVRTVVSAINKARPRT